MPTSTSSNLNACFPYPVPAATPPPRARVHDYRLFRSRLGTTRTVVVTPSNYASDNRCTLDAIDQLGQHRARGVAVIAVAASGVDFAVRVHDLRHAHASWLLAGGSDLKSVMDRMGHAQITTTQKYLHTLPDADAKNLTALDRIRSSGPGSPPEPAG